MGRARRAELAAEVARLFAAHKGKRGSPMITADLREAGIGARRRPSTRTHAGHHHPGRPDPRRPRLFSPRVPVKPAHPLQQQVNRGDIGQQKINIHIERLLRQLGGDHNQPARPGRLPGQAEKAQHAEREGAISDDRIETLLREAIATVAPSTPELRVEPRVEASADLPDNQQLMLGILDFSLRVGGESSSATTVAAREILEHRGGSWRSNKNAAMLIAADAPAIAKARATARTLAALRDLRDDRHRLGRFNAEQREQLAKRLAGAEERLPQQMTMAYRHLLLLGEGNGGGPKLDHVDLGPARVDATIGGRVVEYLRSADRLVETSLAPAALLAARFGLLPEGSDAVELDTLLSYFYRLPRLPKLASPQVLRQALAEGVQKGLFGLASGAAWDAEDSVLRFGDFVDPSEIQFQPGTWLVRAAVIRDLLATRKPPQPSTPGAGGTPGPDAVTLPGEGELVPVGGTAGPKERPTPPAATLPGVTLHIRGVPGSKVRDAIKVAVLPLSAASPAVTVELVIRAEGGMTGIPRETLNLVVLEGLRQLGLHDVDVNVHE